MKHIVPAILIIAFSTAAHACNVPVFRYALERWEPDACDVIVLHDEVLTDSQREFVTQLEAAAQTNGGSANIRPVVQDTNADMDDRTRALWDELREQPDVTLPYVVVRSMIGNGMSINHWHGSINRAMEADLLSSPVRSELGKRLMAGDSAVWLVLKSADEDRNKAVIELLEEQLRRLSEEIPLPEGVGLPGSELFSDIPLLMQFSVLQVDANDPQEQFLVELFRGFEPDAGGDGEPLIVPVFGRGRALEVIPANQVDESLIEDLTLFLCGACSCQVKERNPGFDLLISASWDEELFGDAAAEVAPRFAASSGTPAEPELVAIPGGRSAAGERFAAGGKFAADGKSVEAGKSDPVEQAVETAADEDTADNQTSSRTREDSLPWIPVSLALGVVALVVAYLLKSKRTRTQVQ